MLPLSDTALTNLPLAGIYYLLNGLYVPLNWYLNRQKIDRVLRSGLDRRVPYLEWFFWPYILSLVFIIAGPLALAFFLDPSTFRQFVFSLALIMTVNLVVWTAWPCRIVKKNRTNKNRPRLIHSVLEYGRRYGNYNSFPSAHVSIITLMCLWLVAIRPELGGLWLGFAALNAVSVVFTHQHYVADAASGVALAGAAFWMFAGRAGAV